MSSQTVRRTIKEVKPILSLDYEEARKRALNLYKAWHRQLPYIGILSNFFKHNLTFV